MPRNEASLQELWQAMSILWNFHPQLLYPGSQATDALLEWWPDISNATQSGEVMDRTESFACHLKAKAATSVARQSQAAAKCA